MTWIDGSWDVVAIDGMQLPGRVTQCDVEPKRDVKMEKEKGSDTPHTKDEGYAGADVTLGIEIWRASMWPSIVAALPGLIPRQPGIETKPVRITHPVTSAANVSTVYVQSVKFGMPNKGRLAVTFKMAEWFDPADKKKTKQGINPNTSDGGDFDWSNSPVPDPENRGAKFP